jgi:predicted PurR-regulated permease PerM
MVNEKLIKRVLLFVIVGALFLLAFFVLKEILISIIFALLLAYMFHPIFRLINKKIKNKNLSAGLLILIIIMVVAVPVALLTPQVVRQTFETYNAFQKISLGDKLQNLLPSLIDNELAATISTGLSSVIGKAFSSFLNQFTSLLVNIPSLLLKFAVFLFTFFFSIRDADKLKEYVSGLSPFSSKTEQKFLNEFRNVTDTIVYGQVLIGILQGIALGIGMFVLGVPNALTLTVLAAIASIIPVLGSWLVWLPVSIFLLVSGNFVSGIILLLYGSLFVASIDNVLRPIFLSKRTHLPIAVAVIGTIGGLYFFGITGLVLGPLILAYVLIIIDFYKQGKLNELFEK